MWIAEGFQAVEEFQIFKDYLCLCDIIKNIAERYSKEPHTNRDSSVEYDLQGVQKGSYFTESEFTTNRGNSKQDDYSEVKRRKKMGVKNNMDYRREITTTSNSAITINPPNFSLTSLKRSSTHTFQKLKVCMCVLFFCV